VQKRPPQPYFMFDTNSRVELTLKTNLQGKDAQEFIYTLLSLHLIYMGH